MSWGLIAADIIVGIAETIAATVKKHAATKAAGELAEGQDLINKAQADVEGIDASIKTDTKPVNPTA